MGDWFMVGLGRLHAGRGIALGLLGALTFATACAGGASSPFSPTPYTGGAQPSADGADDGDGGDGTDSGPFDDAPGDDEGADEGVDDGAVGSDCCMRHPSPGCSEPGPSQCVCDELPQCCDDEWTQECVEEGVLLGCLECGAADEGGEPDEGDDGAQDMNMGSCCLEGEGPGCAEAQLAACVCEDDPFCCDTLWDDACAAMVEELGCGDCPGGDDGGDGGMPGDDGGVADDGGGGGGGDGDMPGDGGGMPGGPAPTGGPCCTAQSDPLCGNLIIEACVCLDDPFCCLFAWDATCVEEVESLMCATC